VLIIRGLAWRGRRQVLCAAAGTALAALAGTVAPSVAGMTAASASTTVTLSAAPLGVDIPQWDQAYANTNAFNAIQSLLKAASFREIHYSGGVNANQYDWASNTDIDNCTASNSTDGQAYAEFSSGDACVQTDALSFPQLSADARDLGAQTFATVNYGTGSPASAGDWVAQAAATPGQQVAQWEIGNEDYGCWEPDQYLADCPDTNAAANMTILAKSYAAQAAKYITDMQAADPSAQIGVPWAFDGNVGGAAVPNNAIWNDTLQKVDGANISFVDAHWYPFSFGYDNNTPTGNFASDQQVIQSVEQIPGEMSAIKNELGADGSNAAVVIGETGVSYLPTRTVCTAAGALFAAGDVLEWLAAGAQSVNWWVMDTNTNANYSTGNCQPDEGMFTSPVNLNSTSPQPLTPYYGYLLASTLAQPGAQLSSLGQQGDVLGFQSLLPDGKVAVALINTSTSTAEKANFSTSLSGYMATQTYSAGSQNAANTSIVKGVTSAAAIAGGITLPAESIVVLKEDPALTPKPSAMTLQTTVATSTYKAGSKVTLTGTLTLNGAAAPAGVPVKVYREVSGKIQATLGTRTVAGGTFTITDGPLAAGSYAYSASYVSNTYLPATASAAVKVTPVKTALKLAASARVVRPGQKVTVTATLGASHTNRTLVIYAQPKGGAKKVIMRAAVNARGQLAVAFSMKATTTFTVTFAGDTWYASAAASVAVTT
jgi:hypothetical protein